MINYAGNKDRDMYSKKNSESSIDRGENIWMKAINKTSFQDVGLRQNSHDDINQKHSFADSNN